MGNITNLLLVHPLINLLVAFYQALSFLHIPFALGVSIILLTAAMRLLLYPFTTQQLRATKKMQQLSPHISKLKEKHKGDSKRIQQETMSLYKQHGVNPAAGCLPAVVQIIVLMFGLYPVLQLIVRLNPHEVVSQINNIVYFPFLRLSHPWDTNFFGIPLIGQLGHIGSKPPFLVPDLLAKAPILILVPVITAGLQFLQSKMMVNPQTQTPVKKGDTADFASSFQTQSMYMFPFMIGLFSFTLPIGMSLYWNTFTLFGILQQYQVQGLGGLENWVQKLKKLYGR